MSKVLSGHYLLAQHFLDQLRAHAKDWVVDQAAYTAFIDIQSRQREGIELFTRVDGTARILVRGVLTAEPDFFLDIFGGGNTIYGDIIAALAAADADPEIQDGVLEFDTPGGEVAGFLPAAEAIAAFSKPITAEVTNMAASAGFGLASQADRIIVQDAMTMVGSVGVATTVFVSEHEVDITNTESPDKRPDVTTEAGIATIKAQLDAIHAEFAQVIASGRGTTVAAVNRDFGRGALVIAGEALRLGMIDGIASISERGAPDGGASVPTANKEGDPMTLQELMAQHPGLYAEAVALGVAQERDRVTAHVNHAAAVGRPELASKYITDGTDYGSQAVQATYNTAHLKQVESAERVEDNGEAGGAKAPAGKTPQGGGKVVSMSDKGHVDSIFDVVYDNLDTERKTA